MKRMGWMAVVLVVGLGACDLGGSPSRGDDAAGMSELPPGPWTELARQLVTARDLDGAVATTREVLARGGVATWDGERVLVAAQGPASAFVATPMETVHLAMEARLRATAGRMDVAEFAQMLEAFGWPFADADPTAAADPPILGRPDPETLQRQAEAEQEHRQAEQQARDAERDQLDARRKALLEPAREQMLLARSAFADAQKALRAASATNRDAAMARMRTASDAAKAAQQAYSAAIEQARKADAARMETQDHATEQRNMEERIARRIGPDHEAGDQFMRMLELWVRKAAEAPDDPRSFTPLFLAEMARLQGPPVDLAGPRHVSPVLGEDAQVPRRGTPRSTQLRLTLLEMELIVAAFHRDGGDGVAASAPPDAAWLGGLAGLVVPTAHASGTPCSDIKKAMGPDLGEVHGTLLSEATGKLLDEAFKSGFGEAGADALGNAMAATAIVGKIIKLAAFYANEQVTVTASPKGVHKPLSGTHLVTYTATAGVSPEDLEAYERLSSKIGKADQALRDCMGWVGLPALTTISEVANDAENWLVDWRLVEGAPPHAWFSLRNNDFYLKGVRRATKLRRVSPSSAQADFVVDILPEAKHEGDRMRAYVVARADVDAAGMPSLGTLISAGKGGLGLADSLVEIASGWVMVMFMPKAYAAVEVEYHCPNPTTIHRYVRDAVADGEGEGECTIVFESEEEYEQWRGQRD